jgi:hypothetical protein
MRNHLLGATMAQAMAAAVWSLASIPAAGQAPGQHRTRRILHDARDALAEDQGRRHP